jgi:hypothetical protein
MLSLCLSRSAAQKVMTAKKLYTEKLFLLVRNSRKIVNYVVTRMDRVQVSSFSYITLVGKLALSLR